MEKYVPVEKLPSTINTEGATELNIYCNRGAALCRAFQCCRSRGSRVEPTIQTKSRL
jgi:hypothetical protein